jgi:hypothetical protein
LASLSSNRQVRTVRKAEREMSMSRRSPATPLVLLALAFPLGASAASAGKLPPQQGAWKYDAPASYRITDRLALFRAYVKVTPDKPNIYAMDGTVFGGVCTKGGRTVKQPIVWAALHLRVVVPIKPDGSFAGTRSVVGDATGTRGTISAKGVFNGTRVTGTVAEHLHDPDWGECTGTGKFVSVGELIG